MRVSANCLRGWRKELDPLRFCRRSGAVWSSVTSAECQSYRLRGLNAEYDPTRYGRYDRNPWIGNMLKARRLSSALRKKKKASELR